MQSRRRALARVREQLLSPQRAPVRIARRRKAATPFEAGDVLLDTHDSGRQVLFWVDRNITDKGGTYSIIEPLSLGLRDVTGDLGAVQRSRPNWRAGFVVLDCDRIAADRVQILGRVERQGRPRAGGKMVHASPARNAQPDQTLDRMLDRYLDDLSG
jgi:hypothetical protein